MTTNMDEQLLQLDFSLESQNAHTLANLCGDNDSHIRLIADRLNITIYNRGHDFRLIGSKARIEQGRRIIQSLYSQSNKMIDTTAVHLEIVGVLADQANIPSTTHATVASDIVDHKIFENTQYALNHSTQTNISAPNNADVENTSGNNNGQQIEHAPSKIIIHTPHKHIQTRGQRQANFARNIRKQGVCFGVGPAGTGKTYIAVACAIEAFANKAYDRIIITRPAVEAGEKLGFLPGDFAQKVDPYLRPVFDALYDMLGFAYAENVIAKGIIEVAPLAFMRGRSFNNAFILLDEAQNTTIEQMKMFLTRMGYGSQVVVTGDPSQKDLDKKTPSGLRHALDILADLASVDITHFKPIDIVRHPIVQDIVHAYERQTM